MKGYAGKILRVNLSDRKIAKEDISEEMKRQLVGGRGCATKILWDEVKGVDPLSEWNKIVFSTGPLSGLPLPSSGRMVFASKSPLTGGYGDANMGNRASVHLRRAGYDALIVEGKSETPSSIVIQDGKVEILEASDIWGKTTFEAQDLLEAKHGKDTGVLLIGPGGENMVRFACVCSEKGKAAGRTGIGAVMGSKNLKAIVLKGTGEIPVFDEEKLTKLAKDGWAELKSSEGYDFWIRQATMQVIEWANTNNVLPAYNFREGSFQFADQIGGYAAEKIKVGQMGCPHCNMPCGIIVRDAENQKAEITYENAGLLGSNIVVDDISKVAVLNRLADEYGLDTITLGNCLGFLMEASERGLVDTKLEWGDFDGCKRVIEDLIKNRGLGEIIFEGVQKASERIGGDSRNWAMHVKGLEISAYDCHASPGMALAYGTSPIGAHHKDAWVIAWEVSSPDRFSYTKEKVVRVIEHQRWRGGWFECATTCRLPWIELGFGLDWYPKYLQAITGEEISQEGIFELGDRVYALMRAYWVREKEGWSRDMDYPPPRWFDEPYKQGDLKGSKLDRAEYDKMLSWYYDMRGWDENGIPQKETLEGLGLGDVATGLGLGKK